MNKCVKTKMVLLNKCKITIFFLNEQTIVC